MKSYHDLLIDVIANGEAHSDRTGVGATSVFGRQWSHDMRTGFPLLTTKTVPLRHVFEELRWFLSGSTDRNDLQKMGVKIWDEWISPCPMFPGDMGPIYGAQWRDFGGVDQIANLINDIENNPNSRRIMVNAWNPIDVPAMALPPCHYGFQVKCHGVDEMSLHMTMRSADIFLGVPFNIASYALLLEMLCYVTRRSPRDLIVSFGDLHLYDNHFEQARTLLSREPFDLPTLQIDEIHVPENTSTLQRLLNLTWENIVLLGYKHHPKIKAPVAV